MYTQPTRALRTIAVILGAIILASVGMLLACDVYPTLFPDSAHDFFGGFPLVIVAFAYLLYQSVKRPSSREWVKVVIRASAFLLWAANQFFRSLLHTTILIDIAIALFVLDVFLVMIGWPRTSPDESFAETYVEPGDRPSRMIK